MSKKYIFDPLELRKEELAAMREPPKVQAKHMSNREALLQIQVELGRARTGLRNAINLADTTQCLTRLEYEHLRMLDEQRAFVQELVRDAILEAGKFNDNSTAVRAGLGSGEQGGTTVHPDV